MVAQRFCFLLAAIVAALPLAACESPTAPPHELPITSLLRQGIGAFETPQRLVIRSQAVWEETWNRLTQNGLLPPSMPPVDFSQDMVVITAAGSKPSTGYAISIDSGMATRRTATLKVRSVAPGPSCVVLWVITSPIDIVRVPARDNVQFEEVSDLRSCG